MTNLLTYISPAQQLTVPAPPQALVHPAMDLLEGYMANGFPVVVGPEWSLETISHDIGKAPHSSTLSSESTAFCKKEIL